MATAFRLYFRTPFLDLDGMRNGKTASTAAR